jgi:predicted Zn-dependent protease
MSETPTKQWIALAGIVLAIGAALIWSQMHRIDAPVGPAPVLDFVADTERELSRLPVKFAPLSDSDEIKIGKELEGSYLGMLRGQAQDDEQDIAIRAYVDQVGARVAARARRKLPYRFHYIPSLDFVNAFALPGGAVFIGGGLMALMDTEDELAAVLGHEIEHIDHFHCAERVQIEAAIRKVPLGGLIGIPVEVFVAGYSKNQELEADREGTMLAASAGYSPQGAIQMYQAFERFAPSENGHSQTPEEELSKVALQTLEGYFRSHPLNSERIDQIQKMIAARQVSDSSKAQPLAVAHIFLTERAWRLLDFAQTPVPVFLDYKARRRMEEEKTKQYREAIQLANKSLSLHSDEPRAREALGVAYLGLGQDEQAVAVYRDLIPSYPTYADRLRSGVDSRARQAMGAKLYERARKLAQMSLELQPNRPEALTILLEAQLQLSDLGGASETARVLRNIDLRATAQGSDYARQLAAAHLAAGSYSNASALASLSLELAEALELPDAWESALIVAKAQFALADFTSATKAYQKILSWEPSNSNVDVVRGYAEALAATRPTAQQATDLMGMIRSTDTPTTRAVQVELADVLLTAGDDGPAQRELPALRDVPELMGRLGWWYYKSAQFSTSAQLLAFALAQRPGDLAMQSSYAFDELEQRQWDSAIRRFTGAISEDSWNSPQMGRAVARWQARQTQEALKDFEIVTKLHPEWRDPLWVKASYSETVARTVTEMAAEWKQTHPAVSH